MIKTGTADLIIGFEPGETVRMLPYLKEHGQVVVSTHAIKPVTATLSGSSYDAPPMIDYLKKHVENLTLIDARYYLPGNRFSESIEHGTFRCSYPHRSFRFFP